MTTPVAAPVGNPVGELKEAAAVTAADALLPVCTTANVIGDDAAAALSPQAYLEKSVMGVLALALEDLCRVRPTNPVDYLGSYLLRRSSANNTVEVTYEDTVPKPVQVDAEDS